MSNPSNIDLETFKEYEAVAEALRPYIEAARTGDGALARSAFFGHAHVVGSINGEFSNLDADGFGEAVSSMGASGDVQHRIVSIEVSGPAAAARVEFFNWGGFRFTDFFVLYKHDSQWQISGKVYDSHGSN